MIAQQRGIAAQLLGLAVIIRLFAQLLLRFVEQWRNVEAGGQQTGQAQQGGHVIDVGINAGGNAGILHLDRNHPPIGQLGTVHLPDRGGGNRRRLEPGKPAAPILAPFGDQDLIKLGRRHVMR